MPKVSVIIPVYNVERYIERCARSLFEQTLVDIEYLFINDCTQDKSIDILKIVLKEYPNRVPNVKIIDMLNNSGQAAVRVKGILEATGDYIIHCDSDDWVDKSMYEKMYNTAVLSNSDCVICGYVVSNGTEIISHHKENHDNCLMEDILSHKMSYSLWNKMYKRCTYDHEHFLSPRGNMGEDAIINLQLANKVDKYVVLDEELYYYFENPDSICNTPTKESAVKRYVESSKNIPVLLDFFKSNNLYEKYKAQIITQIANKRVWLIPFLKDDDCYELWKNTCPEINKDLLFNVRVPFKEKIRFIFNYLRIRI